MNKAILKKLVDRHLLLPDLAESVATGYEPTLNEVVSSILTHEIDCEAMTRNNPESTVSFRQACMTRQGLVATVVERARRPWQRWHSRQQRFLKI